MTLRSLYHEIGFTKYHGIAPVVIESKVLVPTPIASTDQVMLPLNNITFGVGLEMRTSSPQAVRLCEQADQLKVIGDRDGAIQKLRDAIAVEPGLVYAYQNLTILLVEKGDHDAALDTANKALYFTPSRDKSKKAAALNNVGLVCKAKGDWPNAIMYLKRSIDLDKNNPAVYEKLAEALTNSDQIHEALEILRVALTMLPTKASLYNTMGVCLGPIGDLDGAIGCYRKATELDPAFGGYLNNWAYVLAVKGEREEAGRIYRLALQVEPGLVIAKTGLARLLDDQQAARNSWQ